MINDILSKEDILCMQYAGMKSSRIMSPKLTPEEYAEAFEVYIDKAESVISMQEEYGVTTLTFQDERFPDSLRKIGHDCPPMIHCLGNMSLLVPKANRIAIIGARAASPIGLRKAYELGKQFAEKDNIIVSGLALGCDKAAHEGCLDANPARLVARNRLQAALSSTVILAECPQQSGSRHTMRFARKYNKHCLVVSYPEYTEVNAGNERLINSNLAGSI